jgi:hypothetical protein
MFTRPRYSLLALLLFTAAVAGGVKLWRGPHHVVDRSNPQMEDEYTYYRDWDGTKVMDGVRIRRYPTLASEFTKLAAEGRMVNFDYYRNGVRLSLYQTLVVISPAPVGLPEGDHWLYELIRDKADPLAMRPAERQVFDEAIHLERQRCQAQGDWACEAHKLPSN